MPCVEFHKATRNKVKLDSIVLILFGGTTDKSGCSIWPLVFLGFDLNPCRDKVAGSGLASRKRIALPMNGEKAIGRDGLSVYTLGANTEVLGGRTLALADTNELNTAGILGMNPLNLTETASRNSKNAEA